MKITRKVEVPRYSGEPMRSGVDVDLIYIVVEMEIDVDLIAKQLAMRASLSKGRKSSAMSGAIVGKVHSVEDVP